MTSPVIAALANAKAAEALAGLRERDNAVEAVVYREVPKPPPAAIPESFRAWCEQRGVCALPARPAAVSLFIMQHRDEGLRILEQLVDQIGAAHVAAGLADPTSTYPVPLATTRRSMRFSLAVLSSVASARRRLLIRVCKKRIGRALGRAA